MDFNINPNGFNSNPFEKTIHQNNNVNIMSGELRAVLYIFKPYENQFKDVGLRPFQYIFDDNFVSMAQEIVDVSQRGVASHGQIVQDMMSKTNFSDQIIPSGRAEINFKASHLSPNYRFILVLTDKIRGLVTGSTLAFGNNNSSIRRIYSGYFIDEPYNPRTFGSNNYTANPNAYMIITHKTVVNMSMNHDGIYGSRNTMNTVASEQIFHPAVSNSLTSHTTTGQYDNSLFIMTPENCMNSVDTGTDGFSYVSHNSNFDNSATSINDVLEQPTHNMGQIVRGIVKYSDDISHKKELMSTRINHMFDNSILDGTNARSLFAQSLCMPTRSNNMEFDLDVNSKISIETLDNLTNKDLDIVPFNNQMPAYYETADQMETSVTNQYSSLIVSVICPILNSAGLNEMSFDYSIATVSGNIQDDFKIFDSKANYDIDRDALVRKVNAVRYELVNGIFSTIFHAMGDFYVAVHANCTGISTINLSLIGQGYKNTVPFEFPSFMGGLVSPLIGNVLINTNNAEKIENLYNITSNRYDNRPSYFNDDDNSFMTMAEEMQYELD